MCSMKDLARIYLSVLKYIDSSKLTLFWLRQLKIDFIEAYTIVDGIYTNNIMFVFHFHLLIVVANEYINYLLLNSNIYRRSAFSKTGIMNDWDDHACRPVSTGVTVVPAV